MFSQAAFVLIALFSFTEAYPGLISDFDANIEQYPYQLALKAWTFHFCGATIISENWALTTATCVERKNPFDLSLHAGFSQLYTSNEDDYHVSEIIRHEKFNPDTNEYDIALLKVEKPFQFSSKVNKIQLPEQDEQVIIGNFGVVSGFGPLKNQKSNEVLKAVREPVLRSKYCEDFYNTKLSDRVFCGGYQIQGKVTCNADIGNPLVYNGKQYGILSYPMSCQSLNQPAVYTNVAAYREWIKEKSQV